MIRWLFIFVTLLAEDRGSFVACLLALRYYNIVPVNVKILPVVENTRTTAGCDQQP
jgi:hypothetical protein